MSSNICEELNLIRYQLLKFKSLQEIGELTNLSIDELKSNIDYINKLDQTNYVINFKKDIPKIEYKQNKSKVHIFEPDKNKMKLMIVSDKHIDHIDDRIGYINDVYDEAERRGVDYVFDLGDVLNGPAEKIHKPNKVRTGTLIGSIEELIDFHPQNIKTHFITGNHDIKFMSSNNCDIGRLIEKECNNFEFLGNLFTSININGLIINLSHGSIENKLISNVNLYKEFPFLTQNNPHIILQGHFHKTHDPILVKNTLLCQIPCLKGTSTDNQSPIDSKNMGALYLTIYNYSKYFDIEYEEVEFVEKKKTLKKEISIKKTKIDF